MEEKKEKGLSLTTEEIKLIEQQRLDTLALEKFKAEYQRIVNETGFAWAVDVSTPINNPKLGIVKFR